MAAPKVLKVENLSVSFSSHVAVKSLTFSLAAGETLALVGESGSGKSATALSIIRLIEREGGSIFDGVIQLGDTDPVDITRMHEKRLQQIRGKRISMVFQEPMTSLNPVMRIGQQLVEVFRRHQNLATRQAIAASIEALERVRIPEPERRISQYPHELSGGLRQRVMIAMALACRPQLLLADEPTTALDVTTQSEILQLIRNLQSEMDMAVLFITHDLGGVAEIADRVLVLKDGQMVETAAVGDLFADPQADYSRQLMAATPKIGSGSPEPLQAGEPILDVQDLSTRFAGRNGLFEKRTVHTAVNGVSLTLCQGETLGLVGESGCGKSTLARSILRLIEPDEGRIVLGETNLIGLDQRSLRARRRAMQIVFQDPFASLNPRMTVSDLVTEPAHLHGLIEAQHRRDLAVSLLEQVGLDGDAASRYPHQFS
ncbi:MAG: ATP-binding cassette domain-containing protein, partial [Pseudomonadota bacterium]